MLFPLLAAVTLAVSAYLLYHVRRVSADACPRCGHAFAPGSYTTSCPDCGWGNWRRALAWARVPIRR